MDTLCPRGLVDLAPSGQIGKVLLIFVEAVASDGPVTESRQQAILALLARGRRPYPVEDTAFVTAYLDRSGDAARRTIPSLAWRSFAWFVSEPDKLLQMHDHPTTRDGLAPLLRGSNPP
jgi:hypothetical protein